MHRLTVRLEAVSAPAAATAVAALAPDNGGFLTARADGSVVVLEASGTSPRALLRTLEDALDCLYATGLR